MPSDQHVARYFSSYVSVLYFCFKYVGMRNLAIKLCHLDKRTVAIASWPSTMKALQEAWAKSRKQKQLAQESISSHTIHVQDEARSNDFEQMEMCYHFFTVLEYKY